MPNLARVKSGIVWDQDLVFAWPAPHTPVTGTVSKTQLVPDVTIPANYFVPGSILRASIWGEYSTSATASPTVTPQVALGGISGSTILTPTNTTLSLATNLTNNPFRWDVLIVCTAIGTLWVQAAMIGPSGLGNWVPFPLSAPTSTTGLTALFQAASALDFNITPSTSGQSWTANLYTLESIGL